MEEAGNGIINIDGHLSWRLDGATSFETYTKEERISVKKE